MLYVIAGDGAGNKTEILTSLQDLREAAALKDEEFWFLLVGKDAPSKTDAILIKWFEDEGIWFEVVNSAEDIPGYTGAQNTHVVKDLNRKALGIITKADEEVVVLALPVDAENTVDEDADLFNFLERVMDTGTKVLLLNAQLAELELESDEDADADEEDEDDTEEDDTEEESDDDEEESDDDEDDEEEGDDDDSAEEDDEAEEPVFTREFLKKMSVPELQALAKGQKIEVRGLGKADLIVALLNLQEEGEAEEEPEPEPEPAKPARGRKPAAAKAEPTVAGASATEGTCAVIVLIDGGINIRFVTRQDALALI